jgi:hypothetical protein
VTLNWPRLDAKFFVAFLRHDFDIILLAKYIAATAAKGAALCEDIDTFDSNWKAYP